MQFTITERISEFINYMNESTNSFSNKIGVSQSTIATALKRNKGVNSDLVEKIIIAYPIINSNWLLTGQGSMLKEDPSDMTISGSYNTVGNRNNLNTGSGSINGLNALTKEEYEKQIAELQKENKHLKTKVDELTTKLFQTQEQLINSLMQKS